MRGPVGSSGGDIDQAARKGMLALIGAQIVGGMGLASGVAVGALIAADLFADPSMAGVPFAASIAGTTVVSLPLFVYMRRSGRRAGLRLAWLAGAAGATAVVTGTVFRSVPPMLFGMTLFGFANAASDAARYAAGDLAERRGRAMGILVFVSTLTAIIGPNLLGPAGEAATMAGLPRTVGPFVLSGIVFAAAGLVLHRLLCPDPLTIRAWRAAVVDQRAPTQGEASIQTSVAIAPPAEHDGRPRPSLWTIAVGMLAMSAANFAMVFAMTAAPAELDGAGHGLTVIGLIVSLHIAAMFAPSPLSGWLSDRIGPSAVILIAAIAIGLSGPLIAAGATGGSGHHHAVEPTVLTLGLLVLGVGWNFAYIGGSALLGEGQVSAIQFRAQGLAEMVRGIAALAGAVLSGLVLAQAGLRGIGVVTLASAIPLGIVATVLPAGRWLGTARRGGFGDGANGARRAHPNDADATGYAHDPVRPNR